MLFRVLLFLVAIFHFQHAKATNSTGIEELGNNQKSADPDCDCGLHGNCSHVNGHNVCKCSSGYAELDVTSEVCNCGSNGTCHFQEGMKECVCNEGFYESHGVCEDFPPRPLAYMLSWREEILIAVFWPVIPPDLKLLSVHVEINTKQNQQFLLKAKANEYGQFQLEYRLTDGRPKEFRHRSETDMGISRWSDWKIVVGPKEHYDPPTILTPVNGSMVHPGSVLVKWEAPHPYMWVDWFEVHLTTVPEWSKYNATNFSRNKDQRLYQTWVNTERENQDYKIQVRCVSHDNDSSEATVFFRTLPYALFFMKIMSFFVVISTV